MTKKPTTLSEHMSKAVKARWAKRTPDERSAYAKMMVQAREAKRKGVTIPKSEPIERVMLKTPSTTYPGGDKADENRA